MRAADLGAPPERVMLDTNVLVAATDEDRAEHADALRVVGDWPGSGTTLCLSGQIVREYLAVATRPADCRGLGLTTADALRNVRAFRGRALLLPEAGDVTDRLVSLLGDVSCSGKQVHDANVVATMLAHNVPAVVTANTGDFTRFAPFVTLIQL